MITGLLLCTRDGIKLYSRRWDACSEVDWEWTLISATSPLWPESFATEDYYVSVFGEQVVVYTQVDEVMMFAIGVDISELGLREVLVVVSDVLRGFAKKSLINARVVQENYGAVLVALEDAIWQGSLAFSVVD
eukprot:RCo009125